MPAHPYASLKAGSVVASVLIFAPLTPDGQILLATGLLLFLVRACRSS